MEHTFPSESFQRENRTTFSEVPFIPEIFQWNEPKTCVPFTSQPEFSEFLGKWKTPRVADRSEVKTCALIGLFALARTVSGYENQALIGQVKERNVVRKRAAVVCV